MTLLPSSTMEKESIRISCSPSRIAFLKAVAPIGSQDLLEKASSDGIISVSSDDKSPNEKFNHLRLADELADASNEHTVLVKGLLSDPEIHSLRDVALKYDNDKLAHLLAPDAGPKPTALASAKRPSTSSPSRAAIVAKFQDALFNAETSAFIQRMLQNGELTPAKSHPINTAKSRSLVSANAAAATNEAVRSGMARVLQNKPDFHFRRQGISHLISDPASLSGVPDSDRSAVVSGLKDLALAQALTSTPKALPTLVQSKLSAFRVAQQPEDQFVRNFGEAFGDPNVARHIHTHAVQVTTRNDHALTSILQAARGTGIAAIDGPEPPSARLNRVTAAVNDLPEQIDLEKLFGSLDYCECSDCTSITSPAAYFVELLQFLRNNDLNPETPWLTWTNVEDFRGSPLDYLFRRRPDIACLELTCANTNTVLPYIDLANEVMESFIYHQRKYANSPTQPKQVWLDIFNASDNADGLGGSSEELMAVPQNTNMAAYQALQQSVYPAAQLPYNQPLDAIRQFLVFLGTTRAEILKVFQSQYNPPKKTTPDTWADVTCPCDPVKPPPPCPPDVAAEQCSDSSDEDCSSEDEDSSDTEQSNNEEDLDGVETESEVEEDDTPGSGYSGTITTDDQAVLVKIHQEALARGVAAEELGISQEEYIALTKQAFWQKAHFDIRHGEEVSYSTYRRLIGVKKDWQYWGLDYKSAKDMLDTTKGKGLAFVKSQFLPRTGILYADLVDILRTNYINPYMPKGRPKIIMESFQFSYQFLASKIDTKEKHRKDRLRPLLQYLEHPVDNDSGFQKALSASLKKHTCCQLLYQNRQPPRRKRRDAENDVERVETNKTHKPAKCQCGCDTELKDWICKYFESVGKVIVLDSGEGQRLPWEGDIVAYKPPIPIALAMTSAVSTTGASTASLAPGEILVGHIHSDGSITETSTSATKVGYVALDGVVYNLKGDLLVNSWSQYLLKVVRTDQVTNLGSDGSINMSDSKLQLEGVDTPTPWTVVYDDCDLTKGKRIFSSISTISY
jgi:hypothetical protein